MSKAVWGNASPSTVICIDDCRCGILSGRLYQSYPLEGCRFRSLMELLLEMETLLESKHFPQAFMEERYFSEPQKCLAIPASTEESMKGRCATFEVRVLFRQNASWQGSISWLEGEKGENFRSVLEMLLLINSALNAEPDHIEN